MTRPATLFEAAERIAGGAEPGATLAEFLDTFYGTASPAARLALLCREPPATGQPRQDALMAAVAEYLAKQHCLPAVPPWVTNPARCLKEPWFTTDSASEAMREYLAVSSPAEFRHHNIFTEAQPLRRASQRRSDAD
jgi:hypothetical protein